MITLPDRDLDKEPLTKVEAVDLAQKLLAEGWDIAWHPDGNGFTASQHRERGVITERSEQRLYLPPTRHN